MAKKFTYNVEFDGNDYSTLRDTVYDTRAKNNLSGGGNTALIQMEKAIPAPEGGVGGPLAGLIRGMERATSVTPTSSGTSGSTTTKAAAPTVNTGYDYASMVNDMLSRQRAAAEAAYANSMGRLTAARDNSLAALRSNLDATLERLKNQYDYSSGVVNDDAAKSLREAYVNYMLNRKNLNQNLSAAGLSGGATESTNANMYNNYGNSRNGINQQLADNLAQLLNEYQNNASTAQQAYNSQYADVMNSYANNMNQLESALANNLVSSFDGGSLSNLANYAQTLAKLNNTGAYTPTENTMGVNAISTTQGNDMGEATTYARYKNMVDYLTSQGANSSQIIQQLRRNGASLDDIFGLFNV
jgi:hypothetical protein